MSNDAKPKVTGIAAVGAVIAAAMMKGGLACGSALSHVARPAAGMTDEAVRAAAPVAASAETLADDAVRAGGTVVQEGAKAADEGGRGLVERAGETAARRAARSQADAERIVDAATSVTRGEIRRRQREAREREREVRNREAERSAK